MASCQKVPSYPVQLGQAVRGVSIRADGRAFFHGVGSCGDVWACPVCSLKVAESRRDEINTGLKALRCMGGSAALLTMTHAHSRGDSLADQMRAQKKALTRAKGSRRWRAALAEVGYIGAVRAIEITHGEANGWHPHVHEILFFKGAPTQDAIEALRRELFECWSAACVKCGLGEPSPEHGLDIRTREQNGSDSIGSYLTKWSFELSHAHRKQGRLGGRTPGQILSDLHDHYSARDSALYREYAGAVKGRARVYWSRGLKALLGIDEVSDDEIADGPEHKHLCDISDDEWRAVVFWKAWADVLDHAETAPMFLKSYLEELVLARERAIAQRRADRLRLQRQVEESTRRSLAKMGLLDAA